jgi:Domain of unknown function (DUF4157)
MSARVRDATTADPTAERGTPADGLRAAPRLPSARAAVLSLQRAAGNRAVGGLVTGRPVALHAKCAGCAVGHECMDCRRHRLQRKPTSEAPAPVTGTGRALLVPDDAERVAVGQMRKSTFLTRLHREICAAAEPILATVGRDTSGCPYLHYWFDLYRERESVAIEGALRRYAPEAESATRAEDYIAVVVTRVRRAVTTWVRTGEITGVPEGVPLAMPSGFSSVAETGTATPGAEVPQRMASDGGAPAQSVEGIRSRLGDGALLDAGMRGRMGAAFGHDFSQVRVHTNGSAARLSRELNARAFTIGTDIAFGAGEYRPGTVMGDMLIAHELAHVTQQAGGNVQSAPSGEDRSLEAEADLAAVQIGLDASPASLRRRRGLRLQRCAVVTGGGISPSAFNFEQVTGGGDPNDRSLPWWAACVNITLTFVSPSPRMQICQFEVGYPGVHRRGRTDRGEAQSEAAAAFDACVPAQLRRRSANCFSIARCVQARLSARIPGARVNSPCVTKLLTPTDWPTRH